MYLRTIVQVPERSHEKPNFRAAIGPEAALEEDLDVLEDEVAGLLHLEGEGVAVEPREPDNDAEEALGEVLDRAPGRKQHLLSTTETPKADTFVVDVVKLMLIHAIFNNSPL